jgi:NAD(P)-dependent dehydrogenase (short-subunit alcohol dehydrogenase family)
LGAKGANILAVYTSDSSTKLAQDLCSELQSQHGVKAVLVQSDLNNVEQASSQIVDAAKASFSDDKGNLLVNIIVNNAGVGGDYKLGEVPVAEFHRMYQVNVLAPICVTQALLPHLPTDRSGRIVNISSVASSMGFATHTLYGGTKAALEAMTRTWARELAERATVNAVNPGPVEGDMYFAAGEKFWKQMEPFQLNCPLSAVREGVDRPELVKLANEKMGGRRPAYWTEVAAVVGMLAGPDSAWCTGSVICANGGFKFQT